MKVFIGPLDQLIECKICFLRLLETVDGNDREVEIWCSNDYLNMSQNPEVLDSCINVINKLGTGSGGTRNISGTSSYHVKLEQTLAELHNKEGVGLSFCLYR